MPTVLVEEVIARPLQVQLRPSPLSPLVNAPWSLRKFQLCGVCLEKGTIIPLWVYLPILSLTRKTYKENILTGCSRRRRCNVQPTSQIVRGHVANLPTGCYIPPDAGQRFGNNIQRDYQNRENHVHSTRRCVKQCVIHWRHQHRLYRGRQQHFVGR